MFLTLFFLSISFRSDLHSSVKSEIRAESYLCTCVRACVRKLVRLLSPTVVRISSTYVRTYVRLAKLFDSKWQMSSAKNHYPQ